MCVTLFHSALLVCAVLKHKFVRRPVQCVMQEESCGSKGRRRTERMAGPLTVSLVVRNSSVRHRLHERPAAHTRALTCTLTQQMRAYVTRLSSSVHEGFDREGGTTSALSPPPAPTKNTDFQLFATIIYCKQKNKKKSNLL